MAVEKVSGDVVGLPKGATQDVPSVVQGNIVVKKPTGFKRLWKGFFAEDLKTVRSNVVENVVKPSVKSGIANAITSAIYMWLFGNKGYANAPGGIFRPLYQSNSNVNYANMYRIQNGPVVAGNGQSKIQLTGNAALGGYTAADVYDPEYIHYPSYEDAENVYIELAKRISEYTVATVRNLYQFSSVSNPEVILQNWGWYDIPWHKVIPVGDGTWILKLPAPCFLNAK